MHDIRAIRADPEGFDAAMARRGLGAEATALVERDALRRAAQGALQDAQSRRNAIAKEVGLGRRTGADTTALEAEAGALRDRMEALEAEAAGHERDLHTHLARLPNRLDAEVPDGVDETGNVELKRWGDIPAFDFAPKQHFEIGEALGLMDFEAAARLAGSRFTVLRGPLARGSNARSASS